MLGEGFGYDELNRLVKRNGATYATYDDKGHGNLLTKVAVDGAVVTNRYENVVHLHAVSSYDHAGSTGAMLYDENGNVAARSANYAGGGSETWAFRYPGFDKPRWMAKTVTAPGGTQTVARDPDGVRLWGLGLT